MDAFHLTVKARTQQDTSFSYPWKCKEIPLTILCFAYDLLMFCKVDAESLRVYKEVLDEFVGLSELHDNANKSHIIVSGAASVNQQLLASQLGFQIGSLPLKYLGVPLVSLKLTIQEAQPLLRKMERKILGWGSLSVSFAARIQLIKVVLTAMFLYWRHAFFLLSTVIERIECTFKRFLWRGNNSRGYVKEAWAQVCLPKERGRQGLKG
ncbi:UNVERIFIED_CONTAM: hypothetical protein Sradi_6980100 [Sesamum radiatum]|uniref:Uncharacterized protein n=1 Tax=Sesamum radiatum TaxID=300843 RepID=A0AAW2JEB1_SESRA